MLKLNFFTIGSTDFTHGGSSFFNYCFIKKYNSKFKINVFFLNEKKSFFNETNKKNFIKKNKNLKLNYFFFKNTFKFNTLDIGKLYFERIHDIQNVRIFFNKNLKLIKYSDYNFCRDFVWAKLLSEKKIKSVCLIGDPLIEQIYFDYKNIKNYSIKKIYIYFKYFFLKNYLKKFLKDKELKKYTSFITHVPHCKNLYESYGLRVKYVPTFQQKQKITNLKNRNNSILKSINLLFLGRSGSSASRNFFNELDNLCEWLSTFKRVNLLIVSDIKINYESRFKNINIIFLKKQNDLSKLVKKIDFGIYFSSYNIGIRQRILFMMSFGIPVICNINNKNSFIHLKDMKDIVYYESKKDFINKVFTFINNKKLFIKLKKNSLFSQRKFYDMNKNLRLHMNEILKIKIKKNEK